MTIYLNYAAANLLDVFTATHQERVLKGRNR